MTFLGCSEQFGSFSTANNVRINSDGLINAVGVKFITKNDYWGQCITSDLFRRPIILALNSDDLCDAISVIFNFLSFSTILDVMDHY